MTIQQKVANALAFLDQLEQTCHSILDLEIDLPSGPIIYPLNAVNISLRDAIDYCRDTLKSELIHVEQGEAAEHLAAIFAGVAHNLDDTTLPEAIHYLQSSIETLINLEESLVRLKIEAKAAVFQDLSCLRERPRHRPNAT